MTEPLDLDAIRDFSRRYHEDPSPRSTAVEKSLAYNLLHLADEVERLRGELRTIRDLDPENSLFGHNEWGEAEMFGIAQEIARKAVS